VSLGRQQGFEEPDCLGEEVVTESGSHGSDALVPPARCCRVKRVRGRREGSVTVPPVVVLIYGPIPVLYMRYSTASLKADSL